MKYIFIFSVFLLNIFGAEYEIYQSNQKIGDIKNINTINKGYLVTETTDLSAILLGFKRYIIFYSDKKPNGFDSNALIEDKEGLIPMLKSLSTVNPNKSTIIENDKFLFNIKCNNQNCTYRGLYKETIKTLSGKVNFSKGLLSELSNNELNLIIKRKI